MSDPPEGGHPSVMEYLADLPLVDHHCHGVLHGDVDRAAFEALLTEAAQSTPLGGSLFDSRIGAAVRRWCAPVLDLPAHSPAEDYLARRIELGCPEVTRRLLTGTGTASYLVDTGFQPELLTTPAELAAFSHARAAEIVRLESVAEAVLRAGTTAAGFAAAATEELWRATVAAAGVKSIAAYRVGLELAGQRPTHTEVTAAAGQWLRQVEAGAPVRCADQVLSRFLIWAGIDRALPIQFHVGLGDADVDLHRCNPLLLTELLRATAPFGVPMMLLHNYPFHRQAGYLAQVFPQVFVDVGLATHNLGDRAATVLGETLELAPFGKVLFSSDGFGLPELHFLGALLFRRGLSTVLGDGVAEDSWSAADAERFAGLMGAGNAWRVYRLGDG